MKNTHQLLLTLSLLFSPLISPAQNCTPEEVAYLAENQALLAEVSQGCAFSCIFSFNQDQCLLDCLSQDIMVSEGCLACSVAQINCVTDNCALQCINANSQACQDCIEQNCMPNYFECIGANPNGVNENQNETGNVFLSVRMENGGQWIVLDSDAIVSIYSLDGKIVSTQSLSAGKHLMDGAGIARLVVAYDQNGRKSVMKIME